MLALCRHTVGAHEVLVLCFRESIILIFYVVKPNKILQSLQDSHLFFFFTNKCPSKLWRDVAGKICRKKGVAADTPAWVAQELEGSEHLVLSTWRRLGTGRQVYTVSLHLTSSISPWNQGKMMYNETNFAIC